MSDFRTFLSALQSQRDLSRAQMASAIQHLLSGMASQTEMAEFLTRLHRKGESADELAGAALAMRAAMRRIDCRQRPVLDTCGTGGDGSQTFNISTAAAIVVAAAGQKVAKHGNRKITSRTGSADVLAELGINLEAPPEVAQSCLEQLGICFCFAPLFHPAMRHVGEVRRQLGHPTIFNRLGPLANPAGAECQVLGVGEAALQDKMASTLQQLGTVHSLVVRGEDGVDEISISGPTRVLEVTPAAIHEHRWSPESFGADAAPRDELLATDPASSADCIRRVLAGERGPRRDVVVINAAAAVWLAHPELSLTECAAAAAVAIDSGRAQQIVERLGRATR